MKSTRTHFIAIFAIAVTIGFNSCIKDKTPTKELMVGIWEVTAAYDEQGNSILNKINFPVTAFSLNNDNTVLSSAGPMMTYVVYGPGNYANIASKLDQVFNYASGSFFNGGEFFISDGVQERFTLEMKLEAVPGMQTLTYLLNLLGVTSQWMNLVVYHKFMDVNVTFNNDNSVMYWNFDSTVKAVYNYKDGYGNYVLWNGFPVSSFQHCRFELTKRSTDLKTIVTTHH